MQDAEPTRHWISGKASWQGDPGEYLTPLSIKQGIDSVTRGKYWKLSAQGWEKDRTQPPIIWIWAGLYLVFRIMSSEHLIMEHENAGWRSFKYSFCCNKWSLLCIRTPSACCQCGSQSTLNKMFSGLPNTSAQATWGWKKASQSIPFPFFPSLNSGPLCMFKGFFLADFQL